MLIRDRNNPRGFADPNDYAFMHGDEFCGAVPETDGPKARTSHPNHCLHGNGKHLACCWCGDCFVGNDVANGVHGNEFHPLTPREVEVLKLVAEGLTNKLVGARLNISEDSANFHVINCNRKLGKPNRVSTVAEAIRRGIIP